ncbi:MAG: helix-turn-helix domain-containing protein [Treponema sp.]|nr:helix-turn-helix domain-containing protein [Treponema sp.]
MAGLRETFAKNLKENRRKCGFSQAKLAEMVGVSTHHIAMIELTRNFPAAELVERIAKAMNIKIFELFVEDSSISADFEMLRKLISSDIRQLFEEYLEKLTKKEK